MKEPLSKSEWMVMEALWEHSPMFLSEIMDAMKDKVNWKKSTFSTYLKILIDKEYIGYETIRNSRSYYPAVQRDESAIIESRSVLARMTEQTTKIFLSNMIKEGSLTKADRAELRNLIDRLEEADQSGIEE